MVKNLPTFFVVVVEGRSERSLSPLVSGDLEGRWTQNFLPFLLSHLAGIRTRFGHQVVEFLTTGPTYKERIDYEIICHFEKESRDFIWLKWVIPSKIFQFQLITY